MGKATAIYIRSSDLPLWERLERHAAARRQPVSGVVLLAVEEYLAKHDPPAEPKPKRR